MKNIKLSDYKKNRVDKLDSVTTGVNLERRHKEFLESHGVNLSALVRDILDALITDDLREREDKPNEEN